ncbi:lipopolysaccharide-induced tumor necrosis factor-alpha factor homolog [Anticarsia gemmatalis]|uniref:lipopolysaccharide-induced tumor necrosis factor-alpha factor homolog n=1 Tax=Anticarsia gemmatalis TaxID=129554 RepID=UPI003F76BF53
MYDQQPIANMNTVAPIQPDTVTPVPVQSVLGPKSTSTTCQFCRALILTRVRYTSNSQTHIAAALCGLIYCCCCLPYCCKSAKNADHYCPQCHKYLGTYAR